MLAVAVPVNLQLKSQIWTMKLKGLIFQRRDEKWPSHSLNGFWWLISLEKQMERSQIMTIGRKTQKESGTNS